MLGADKLSGGLAGGYGNETAEMGAAVSESADPLEVLRCSAANELVLTQVTMEVEVQHEHGGADGEDAGGIEAQQETQQMLVDVVWHASLDVESGVLQWNPSYDGSLLHDTIARSQMTSMMHDHVRNAAYDKAISAAVAKEVERQGAPVVLDIGSGTGLLSMMSARAGAQHVVGCEMFTALADVSRTIVQQNQLADSVTIVPARSAMLELPQRANMVVSEIFDSALLGEGVIPSLRDAFKRLLHADAAVVPRFATIHCQLVHTSLVDELSCVSSSCEHSVWFAPPDNSRCRGSASFPVHSRAVGDIREMSAAVDVLAFDFTTPPVAPSSYSAESPPMGLYGNTPVRPHSRTRVTATRSGECNAILFWWSVRDLGLCTGPSSGPMVALERAGTDGWWQDHWLQVLFPLPQSIALAEGEDCDVVTMHDDYRVWFQVIADVNREVREDEMMPPSCTCGVHSVLDGYRLWRAKDDRRVSAQRAAIAAGITKHMRVNPREQVVCIDVSDGSMAAMDILLHHDVRIISLEEHDATRYFAGRLISTNEKRLQGDIRILQESVDTLNILELRRVCEEMDVRLDDAVFLFVTDFLRVQLESTPLLKALSLRLAYEKLRKMLAGHQITMMPSHILVRAAPFSSEQLWTNHGKVGDVCGFDHSALDDVQQRWSKYCYLYPMWMFRHSILSDAVVVSKWALDEDVEESTVTIDIALPRDTASPVHGVVLWVEYQHKADDECIVVDSNAPTEHGDPSHAKQSVVFLETPHTGDITLTLQVQLSKENGASVHVSATPS